MKNKIIIVGLNYDYNKCLSNNLADESGAYFLDVEDYVSYSLFDRKAMKEKCGVEYLHDQEQKAVKSCVDYENAVLNFPYPVFSNQDNYKFFVETSIIVYVRFSENALIEYNKHCKRQEKIDVDLICFSQRDAYLKQASDFVVTVGKKKQTTVIREIISKVIGE